ncbi:MAG: molybdenum hydroxylase, partial [bacterium]
MTSADTIAIIVKGGGDLGSGVVYRLFKYGYSIIVVDLENPTAVRRKVSFCEAIYNGKVQVEGVIAERTVLNKNITNILNEHHIVPVIIDYDSNGKIISELKNNLQRVFKKIVLVDATIAKRNLGTKISDADLVIALGPGFEAGKDVHRVIETNRGENLGRVI